MDDYTADMVIYDNHFPFEGHGKNWESWKKDYTGVKKDKVSRQELINSKLEVENAIVNTQKNCSIW